MFMNADIDVTPDGDAISDEAAGRVPHLRTVGLRSHPLRPAVVPCFRGICPPLLYYIVDTHLWLQIARNRLGLNDGVHAKAKQR
jgi:hypothetical protein